MQQATTAPGRGRAVRAIVPAAIVVHMALAWIARAPGILTGQDDAEYIVLSRSLKQGGYNELFAWGTPVHRTYPPGYPGLLAAWSGLFGDSFNAATTLNIVVSAILLAAFFVMVRRVLDSRTATFATVLLALNRHMIETAGAIMSEPAYILATILALGLLAGKPTRNRTLAAALGYAVLATLTRTAGVTLIAALLVHWTMERRWRLVVGVVGVLMLAASGWMLWSSRGPNAFIGASYAVEIGALWRGLPWTGPLPVRIVRWGAAYLRTGIPWQLGAPTVPGTIIDNLALVVVGSICSAAGFAVIWRRWRPAALYMVCYGLLLLMWLYFVERFALPIIPFLIVSLLAGASRLARRFGARTARWAPALVAVVLVIGNVQQLVGVVGKGIACRDSSAAYPSDRCLTPDQVSYFGALRWIEANVPDDAYVLTSKPGALWLYTGRQGAGYEEAIHRDAATFIEWMRGRGASWILLGSLHDSEISLEAPLLQANCDRLSVEAVFPPRTWLFRILPDRAPDNAACSAVAEYMTLTGSGLPR